MMMIYFTNFWKNIDVNIFDVVLQNAKHRANDANQTSLMDWQTNKQINNAHRPNLHLPWSPGRESSSPARSRSSTMISTCSARCQFDLVCNKPYLFLKDSPWSEGLSIMSSRFTNLSQSRHSQKDWHFTEVCTSRRSELVSSEQRARCLVEKVGSRLARPTNHQSRVGLVLQNILQHNTPLPTLPEITFWLLISWRERQKPPIN